MFANGLSAAIKIVGVLWLGIAGFWLGTWWDGRAANHPAIHFKIGHGIPFIGSIPIDWTAPPSLRAKLDAATAERDALKTGFNNCSVSLTRQNDAVKALGAKSDHDTAQAAAALERAVQGRHAVSQKVAAIAASKPDSADEYEAVNDLILQSVGGAK